MEGEKVEGKVREGGKGGGGKGREFGPPMFVTDRRLWLSQSVSDISDITMIMMMMME